GDSITRSAVLDLVTTNGSGITFDDDGPQILPSTVMVSEELSYTGIKAGNVDERGMDGAGDRDVLLSGEGGSGNNDDAINTTGGDIGVGDQWIDGESSQGQGKPAETLRFDFVNSVNLAANPQYAGHYTVDSASFTVAQIKGGGGNTATVFIQVFTANNDTDYGNDTLLPISGNDITVTGDLVFTRMAVYDAAGTIIGFVLSGLNEGAKVTVNTTDAFNRLVISNYDGVTARTSPGGATTTFSGGSDFAVGGVSSTVLSPITLKVSIDESAGVNTAADPNPANDVAAPPAALAGALAGAGAALGYAQSSGVTASALFTSNFGSDGAGSVTYALTTGTAGGAFAGTSSGLNSTVAVNGSTDIRLYSETLAGVSVVWGIVGGDLTTGTKAFALYLDTDGTLWVAQFRAIAHDADGNTAAAYDDIASITAGLVYVTATVTDGDGDKAFAVSPAGLQINFQDDGPAAVNDLDLVSNASNLASGNVITDLAVSDDVDGDAGADRVGTDGATVSQLSAGQISVSGFDPQGNLVVTTANGSLSMKADGSYVYTRSGTGPISATEVFTYTLRDGDGDTATGTLTVSIRDAGVSITDLTPAGSGGDAIVDEDDLLAARGPGESAGSDGAQPTSTTGTFSFSAPDAAASFVIAGVTFTFAQIAATAATPLSVDTPLGNKLYLTGFSGSATAGTVSYRFELLDNESHGTPGQDSIFDSIDIVIADADNDASAPAVLAIQIVDDVPTASATTLSLSEGGTAVGQLAFVAGADGAAVLSVSGTTLVFGPDGWSQPIVSPQGSLQVKADGSYQFTAQGEDPYLDAGTGSFAFTIRDGDGDLANASLGVTVSDTIDPTTVSLSADPTALEGANVITYTA
ncbi:DUF5801 repeats-in-toxin domain-containing protein, partial [Bosea sp. Leaf344]|uniref:beta strand repeat-containing protein n=1 Tax=Bosea sp. Leaf344 TaxID=1736346 RepID=UPI000B050977